MEIVKCRPLAGSCELHELEWQYGQGLRPAFKTFTSPGGNDCFYHAIASAITGSTDKLVLAEYVCDHMVKIHQQNPVAVKDVKYFETLNQHLDVAVNIVYEDDDRLIYPMHASKNLTAKHIVVLMLCYLKKENGKKEDDDNEVQADHHYVLVRKPSKLFAHRKISEKGVSRTSGLHICWNCFNSMKTKAAYFAHVDFCHTNETQIIQMPEKGAKRAFEEEDRRGSKCFKSAFTLFFDFEALQTEPKKSCICSDGLRRKREMFDALSDEEKQDFLLEEDLQEREFYAEYEAVWEKRKRKGLKTMPPGTRRTWQKSKMCEHKMLVLAEQPPFAFSLLLVDRDFKVRQAKTYVGENAGEEFVKTVLDIAETFLPQLSPGVPMRPLSRDQLKEVRKTEKCYLCGKRMDKDDKVLDHDHLNGQFLGVAHNVCNLSRREPGTLTCFAHNFTGYDSHFLVKCLNKDTRIKDIYAIPLNTQKFKFISVNNQIKFTDSFAFLSDSLAKLVGTLCKENSNFPILSQLVSNPKRNLLLRKGVYPYEFCTSIDRLQKQTSLPLIQDFDSKLTGEKISAEDYAHAINVWKTFNCKNMIDYTKLYVQSDVYLLADVIMHFRENVWKNFKLDVCRYMSLPHLGFDCMLKQTKVEIELISDQEMSDLFKRNIRGGLSYVNTRYAHTHSGSLLYIDANNLYGKAMTFPLPHHSFRWLNKEEISMFGMNEITLEEGPGFILEVDLDYPEELHLAHNSFPLAPHNMIITDRDLSDYSLKCYQAIYKKSRYVSKKLTATFLPRRRYLVHGLNLLLYLKLGMKLRKVSKKYIIKLINYIIFFLY